MYKNDFGPVYPPFFFTVKPDSVDVLAPVLANYKAAYEGGRILPITFVTISDYFWLLRAACECLAACGTRALLYLSAAVSDFYIPSSELVIVNRKSALSRIYRPTMITAYT